MTSLAPTALFVDTSVQIARFHREPAMKTTIMASLHKYEIKVSSRIALQEYKRRILGEAVYLLNLLNTTGSFQATLEHVTNVLPDAWKRKRNICLSILVSLFPNIADDERTERAQRYLSWSANVS
jgi:hypothetical protein